MRCTILVAGTRGDVQPLMTLGAGLRAAGLAVSIATNADYATFAERHGLEFRLVRGRSSEFFGGRAGAAFRDRLSTPDAFRHFYDSYLAFSFERILDDFWAASRDADLLVTWLTGGPSLAERLGVPVFVATPFPPPHLYTGAFPNPFPYGDVVPSGTWLQNEQSWQVNDSRMAVGMNSLNKWRTQTLGLAPIDTADHLARLRQLPHLHGYSPTVVPPPRDWPPDSHITGYWFDTSSADYAPPPALQAFVDGGPPPIAIGFSSQVGANAGAITTAVIDAVGQAGLRAVLVAGLGGLKGASYPPFIHSVQTVPYDWLLPRVRAFVHHCGAGSTGLAVRHGVPQVGVPFGYDQQFWADRIHALGVAPRRLPASELTTERLVSALREVLGNPAMQARAADVAARVNAEDGVGTAVRIILDAVERRVPTES